MSLTHGFFIAQALEEIPKRIISLVPSQTELLFDLGLGERVVGITKFCVHPHQWFQEKTKIGGTKSVDMETIKSLKPDLIIGNKEENTKEMMEGLSEIAPIWISDIENLNDAYDMIAQVGKLTDKTKESTRIIDNIKENFDSLRSSIPESLPKKTAYFIWRKPWMVAGNNTFINHLFSYLNLENIYQDQDRYPEINLGDLAGRNPEIILLSSEPFPFKEKHAKEIKQYLPQAKIVCVDGELFSWYGSRLILTSSYFQGLWKEL